jgi:hypothetical protein
MYDFIKVATYQKGLADRLLKIAELGFNTEIDQRTGVLRDDIEVGGYKNMEITIYPSGRVEIEGSIHKLFNDGHHNWNQFTLVDVGSIIDDFCNRFDIDPAVATVHNLEFAVNLLIPYSPNKLLDALIVHKQDQFSKMKVKGPGNGRDVYYQQYGLKVYNKSLQFKRRENIFRFEVKVTRMKHLGLGVICLSDLKDLELFNKLRQQMLDRFDEVIFDDKVNEDLLTKPDLVLYLRCKNARAWEDMTRQKRLVNKARFKAIINKHGRHKYQSYIRDLMVKTGYKLTGVLDEKRLQINSSYRELICLKPLIQITQLNPVLNAVA